MLVKRSAQSSVSCRGSSFAAAVPAVPAAAVTAAAVSAAAVFV